MEGQLGRNHKTVGDLLKLSFASFSEEDPTFQLALNKFPHDADSTNLVAERVCGSKWEPAVREQRGRIINQTAHKLSLRPSGKTVPRLLSKHDVACVSADQHVTLSTQDDVTNRNEATERREPMGIGAEQQADQNIPKQINRARRKQKKQHAQSQTTNRKQQLDSSDNDNEVPIEIVNPMAVKDELETIKLETGKVSSKKDKTKQPDQQMAPINCELARQLPRDKL